MNIDDEEFQDEGATEVGSDELLSDDNLRLPESANILVRVHAVRAWLTRRRNEAALEVGEAALDLQDVMQSDFEDVRPRRRREQMQQERLQRAQQALSRAQKRQNAYEEAETLLEDCIAHTSGERVLVEYYLTLDGLVQRNAEQKSSSDTERGERSVWLEAIADVQHRIERVGIPNEEES